MFSRKEWVDPPFCLDEVNGDPALSTQVIQGSKPTAKRHPASVRGVAAAPGRREADVIVVGAGLAGLVAARQLVAGGPQRAGGRGARPGRGTHRERLDRGRQGDRDGRAVGRADPGAATRPGRRTRHRDLPHLPRGAEPARARRQAPPLQGNDPAARTARPARYRPSTPQGAPRGAPGAGGRALDRGEARRAGLADVRQLDPEGGAHEEGPPPARDRDRDRDGHGQRGALSPLDALLRQLGRRLRRPDRRRGWCPAGPVRRRLSADLPAAGRGSRRRRGALGTGAADRPGRRRRSMSRPTAFRRAPSG